MSTAVTPRSEVSRGRMFETQVPVGDGYVSQRHVLAGNYAVSIKE